MTTKEPLALQGLPPGDAALWERIAGEMVKRIDSGLWASGQQLLAETELAGELGVARGTLRRAIRELCDAGYLVQRHGLGTFVAKRQGPPLANRMESLGERMSRAGLAFETRELSRTVVADGTDYGLDGEPALVVRRVRAVEAAPVAVLCNAVPLRVFPGIEDKDLTSRPLYSVLEDDFDAELLRAERTFRAFEATDEIASLLGLRSGAPVLNFVQVTYGPYDVVLDVAETWIRSDRHQPTVSMWRTV